MDKIHFAALFGVDLDYDIAPFWREHYTRQDYDDYTVFLHSTTPNSERCLEQVRAFERAGFKTLFAPSCEYSTAMRNTILDTYAKSLPASDYLVTADSDEFQLSGINSAAMPDLIRSCDTLSGELVDRWDTTLHAAVPGDPLEKQYPYSGDLFACIYKDCDASDKERWRIPHKRKILAARAGIPVAYMGSHVLYSRENEYIQKGGCFVYHYKWRHTIRDRLKSKWYFQESMLDAVVEYFDPKQKGVPA